MSWNGRACCDCDALSDAYICFPDLRCFLLYRFLERTDVVQKRAIRLHVHRTIRADRVDIHEELLRQREDVERAEVNVNVQTSSEFNRAFNSVV